ncbi:MAG: TraR/DksA C4-type zinc finger protein [Ilumatobacteraceae bacterium]
MSTHKHLQADLDSAVERLEALETEYNELLSDSGTIQEDRDSTRILLEATRTTVEAARKAIASEQGGTYGRCVKCGEPIPPERLEAIPEATMCVLCVEKGR